MTKSTKPKAVKPPRTQAKSSPAGGKKATHTRKKPDTAMASEAHQSEANDNKLNDPTSPATTSAPKAPVTGPWDERAYAHSCTEISSGTGHGLLTDDCLLLLSG